MINPTMFDFENHEGRLVIISIDGDQNPQVTIAARNADERAERGYRLDLALESIMEESIARAMDTPRRNRD